jgi:NitT/TauT family transport system substrate-binding protein
MMNEINKLIWPSPNKLGIMDPDLYQQTADIALTYEVITKAPDEGAWRNDLVEAAVAQLEEEYPDLDLVGADWKAAEVEITPKGE